MNVSRLKLYLECQRKFHHVYISNRVPHTTSPALTLGTAWHVAMEQILKKAPPDAAIRLAEETLGSIMTPELLRSWTALKLAIPHFQVPPDWRIDGTEIELTGRTSLGYEIEGRLDALVWWNAQYWHLQHKTIAATRSMPTYWAAMQRDWHECIYQWLALERGYRPYGGTILNVVRKLSMARMAENPQAALNLMYIPRPQSMAIAAAADFERIMAEISLKPSRRDFIQNRSACAGLFGNSLCPFIRVCNQEVSLDDDALFTIRTEPGSRAGVGDDPTTAPLLPQA